MLLSILLFINLSLFCHKLVSSFDQSDHQKQKEFLQQQHDHVIGKAGDNRLSDGRNFRNSRRLSTDQTSSGINDVNSTLPLLPVIILSFAEYSRKSLLKHLPQSPDLMALTGQIDNKLIPRYIWIAVKDKNEELPPHLMSFCSRNPSWLVNICDNECKDHFMGPSGPFAGTSVSWAYFLINPLTGAAKADIWRYSVLYAFGGFYIDDDSDMKTDLDEIVRPDDHMILSEEGPSDLGSCYVPSFHLSDQSTFSSERFGLNYSSAEYYHSSVPISSTDPTYPSFFHGNTILNWGMFARPRHPVLATTVGNIVSILSNEYYGASIVAMRRWDKKWKLLFCSTGLPLMYTIREMALENSPLFHSSKPRICSRDFKEYRGRAKAISTAADANHYMKAMQRPDGPQLLREYARVTPEVILKSLNGRTVMGDHPDKAIYWIINGTKRAFPDFGTFLWYNISQSQIRHVKSKLLNTIPFGPPLTSINL